MSDLLPTETNLYRKKPVAVRAFLWQGDNGWGGHVPSGTIHSIYEMLNSRVVGTLNTSEGPVSIVSGQHYIVGPGAGGEFWPVRKDIFEATYERA